MIRLGIYIGDDGKSVAVFESTGSTRTDKFDTLESKTGYILVNLSDYTVDVNYNPREKLADE